MLQILENRRLSCCVSCSCLGIGYLQSKWKLMNPEMTCSIYCGWMLFQEKAHSLGSVLQSANSPSVLEYSTSLDCTFKGQLLIADLFKLAGTGFSLSGSPCWQTVPCQRGLSRRALCSGTARLYSPCPASCTHSMSSPSPWRQPWLKGSTSNAEKKKKNHKRYGMQI